MRFKLQTILESTILLEGRKEDVIKKYGEEHSELINLLSDSDPSGSNKYLDWMVKTSLGQNQDQNIPLADNVVRVVTLFHEKLPKIKKKDLNSYKSLDEVSKAILEVKKAEEEKKLAKQAKKIYEDDIVTVYAPFTWEASCKYGRGSKWCVAMVDNPRYFKETYKNDNFYFFLRKDITQADDNVNYKWALQVIGGDINNLMWWDALDDSSKTTPDFVTSEMMDAVKAFNPSHKKIKHAVRLQAFLDSPTIDEYKFFRDVLSAEQIKSVINDIIANQPLDSDGFTKLVADLTDEQKNMFIDKYSKGTVSVSDYKKMDSYLNNEQKMNIVLNNPTILNSSAIIESLDTSLDRKDKYNISNKIDKSKITATDSRIIMRKWGMSEKDLREHEQYSSYVFLSSDDKYIHKLTFVDPLDPESHKIINNMKMRKDTLSYEYDKPTKMFGIKTKKGLLEDYVGMSSDDIPEDLLKIIKSKEQQIFSKRDRG